MIRRAYLFLLSDSRLCEKERESLVYEGAQMYFRDESQRDVHMDTLEGRIETKGDYVSLGCFSGVQYDATLETTWGKTHVRFLIDEITARAYGQTIAEA